MLTNDNMLQPFQIVYASAATRKMPHEEVNELLSISRKNNASVHVGGLLVFHDDCFLQVIEGPRIAVEAIYLKIKTDPRHTNVKLLLRCGITQTQFSDWAMAYVDASGGASGLESYVAYLEKLETEFDSDTQAFNVLRQFKSGHWRELVNGADLEQAV